MEVNSNLQGEERPPQARKKVEAFLCMEVGKHIPSRKAAKDCSKEGGCEVDKFYRATLKRYGEFKGPSIFNSKNQGSHRSMKKRRLDSRK